MVIGGEPVKIITGVHHLKEEWRDEVLKQKYIIPFDTKVEIISKGGYNGRIGTLGAKYPGNLQAHNVYFDKEEFATFMDDEFIPVQNIITIDNLKYETLCKVFDHNYIYDTDRIIVKQKNLHMKRLKLL